MRETLGNTLPAPQGNTTPHVVGWFPGETGAAGISAGAAGLSLAIVLAGLVSLLVLTYWEYRKQRYSRSLHQGNKRIRRELGQHINHWGNDD